MIPVMLLNILLPPQAVLANPAPIPLFLKAGFSSVLEFDAKPTRVVIGNAGSFQVERLEKSLVVRAFAEEATTNLIVYFADQPVRMFLLRATQEEEPALYRKFGLDRKPAITLPPKPLDKVTAGTSKVLSARFDKKRDFLTVKVRFAAERDRSLTPVWAKVRLDAKGSTAIPHKIWAERKEVQAGTFVDTQFIFRRPSLGNGLPHAHLVVPLRNTDKPLTIKIGMIR